MDSSTKAVKRRALVVRLSNGSHAHQAASGSGSAGTVDAAVTAAPGPTPVPAAAGPAPAAAGPAPAAAGPAPAAEPRTFADLGLEPALVQRLAEQGVTELTPVQAQALGPALAGQTMLCQGPPGSGKTMLYVLPILQQVRAAAAAQGPGPDPAPAAQAAVKPGRPRPPAARPTAIVACSTHDLASQVLRNLEGTCPGVRACMAAELKQKGKEAGQDAVVGTPSQLRQVVADGAMGLDRLRLLALDECDDLMDRKDLRLDLQHVWSSAPDPVQLIMVCSTISEETRQLCRRFRLSSQVQRGLFETRPVHEFDVLEQLPRLKHAYVQVVSQEKDACLLRLLTQRTACGIPPGTRAIVVASSFARASAVVRLLKAGGIDLCWALHEKMEPQARLQVYDVFGELCGGVLVTTDRFCRGLRWPGVDLVISYDLCAGTAEGCRTYLRRVGRACDVDMCDAMAVSLVTNTRDAEQLEAVAEHYDYGFVNLTDRVFPATPAPAKPAKLANGNRGDKRRRDDAGCSSASSGSTSGGSTSASSGSTSSGSTSSGSSGGGARGRKRARSPGKGGAASGGRGSKAPCG